MVSFPYCEVLLNTDPCAPKHVRIETELASSLRCNSLRNSSAIRRCFIISALNYAITHAFFLGLGFEFEFVSIHAKLAI